MAHEFQTDEEFRTLLPPHSSEERETLERLIVEDGRANEAVVVWKEENILVDGYTRHEICEDRGLPYDVRFKSFQDRTDAIIWVRQNQIGRRNLTEQTKKAQLGKLAREMEANQSGKSTHEKVNVAKELAKKHGTSPRTIARAKIVADALEKVTPPVRARYENGDLKLTDREVEHLSEMSVPEQLEIVESLDNGKFTRFYDAKKDLIERSAPQRDRPSSRKKKKPVDDVVERETLPDGSTIEVPEMLSDIEAKATPNLETSLFGIDESIEQAFKDLRTMLDRRADYVGKTPRYQTVLNVLRHAHTVWSDFKAQDRNTSRGKAIK